MVNHDKDVVAPEEKRHVKVKESFRKFWIGGLAGAFFTAVTRSVAVDWKTSVFHNWRTISSTPQALSHIGYTYTAEVMLRYAYMLWLMGYFFVAVFDLDQLKDSDPTLATHNRWDISFDAFQSVLATIAIIVLTSVAGQERNNKIDHLVPNIVVALIGGVSWVLFKDDTARVEVPFLRLEANIAWLRIGTMLLGSAGVLAVLFLPEQARLLLLIALFFLLCIVLWSYFRLRIKVSSTGEPRRFFAWLSQSQMTQIPAAKPPKPVTASETPNPQQQQSVGGGGSNTTGTTRIGDGLALSENEPKTDPQNKS